ncbi:protein-tyrosine phosphatase-like protein [Gamsiella multidivaricata]|uniref:protein-tyrosine phosphatase-like protein n=1 Tax=Gamsiella multidivaricata TaxID=101098 RepID=UPI00221E43A5|nr:protein-tyrosine phosphatase-like protein [Gamsiella multidivaricata]KAG0364558.1 hypothetical protein BGZ54_007375 [Gamsiella multidivaricata]KAI7826860.1 protein-tyrosine phosphatase-like protein [Gamsiella multidivaricata]
MSIPRENKIQVQMAEGIDHGYQNNGSVQAVGYYKSKSVSFKDSISHPINVSWIIPPWIDALLQQDMSVPNNLYLIPYAQREAEAMQKMEVAEDAITRAKKIYPNWRPRGNLGLSSCPGKKVRLDGPVNGRAKIVRDLDLDFDRLQKLGFTRVVCCLFDEELELLGSPFPKYLEAANSHGLDVIRIPMIEGSTPYSFAEMDRILDKMDETTRNGQNVLAHCRGGVGRAAVVACCWLLRLNYFKDHREVIEWVRAQRSPKAIETKEQAHFVAGYHLWVIGGQSRSISMMYEGEIKRRIDWAEANMAHAREDAAIKNEHGHHDLQCRLQEQQAQVQQQSQQELPQTQLQLPINGQSTSSAQHQSQQQSKQYAQQHVQQQNQQHVQQQIDQVDHIAHTQERFQPSPKSITSTATVSSRQADPVSPSSLSGMDPTNGFNPPE